MGCSIFVVMIPVGVIASKTAMNMQRVKWWNGSYYSEFNFLSFPNNDFYKTVPYLVLPMNLHQTTVLLLLNITLPICHKSNHAISILHNYATKAHENVCILIAGSCTTCILSFRHLCDVNNMTVVRTHAAVVVTVKKNCPLVYNIVNALTVNGHNLLYLTWLS